MYVLVLYTGRSRRRSIVVTLFVRKGRVTCIHTYTQHGNCYNYWDMKRTGIGSWPRHAQTLATAPPSVLGTVCGLVCCMWVWRHGLFWTKLQTHGTHELWMRRGSDFNFLDAGIKRSKRICSRGRLDAWFARSRFRVFAWNWHEK